MSKIEPGGTVWFSADVHLGHGNIGPYCQRQFMSAIERERAAVDARGAWRLSPESVARHDAARLDAINSAVREPEASVCLYTGRSCRRPPPQARSSRGPQG